MSAQIIPFPGHRRQAPHPEMARRVWHALGLLDDAQALAGTEEERLILETGRQRLRFVLAELRALESPRPEAG